ncbi:MAG: hypothetical protein ACOZJZ_04845, partial [Pseudomonadota bacterium]
MDESLDSTRWQRVKGLLADALERPPQQRQRFIDEAAGGDAALRAELNALVAAAGATGSLLDQPPAELTLHALQAHAEQSWIGRRVGPWRL